MEHLFLLLDTLSLLIGFGTFIGFSYVTFQSKDRTMFHILVFFLAFTLEMVFTLVYEYLQHNVTDLFSNYSTPLFYIQISIGAFLIFSVPFFTTGLVKSKHSKIINLVFLIVAFAQIYGAVFTEYSGYFFRVGVLAALLFSVSYLVIGYKSIPIKTDQKLVARVGVIALVSFLSNLLQLVDFIVLFRLLVPITYGMTCAAFILYMIEKYFKGVFLTDDGQQVFNQYGYTTREEEVVTLLLKGYSNPKIADLLHISLSTVKSHIHNVFRKTEVSNRYELIHLLKFNH